MKNEYCLLYAVCYMRDWWDELWKRVNVFMTKWLRRWKTKCMMPSIKQPLNQVHWSVSNIKRILGKSIQTLSHDDNIHVFKLLIKLLDNLTYLFTFSSFMRIVWENVKSLVFIPSRQSEKNVNTRKFRKYLHGHYTFGKRYSI